MRTRRARASDQQLTRLRPTAAALPPISDLAPQELTALVLEVLRGRARHVPRDLWDSVDRFVTAGSRALAEASAAPAWRAWGLPDEGALDPTKAARRARALRQLIASCRRDRAVSACFFMRKAPGIRFRVETRAPERVEALVARWLRRQGLQPFALAYEPEEYQFGGPVGMAIAHRHFTVDSVAALHVEERRLQGALSAPPWLLSLLCVMDLLSKLTSGDHWEIWDLWSNLRLAGRLGGRVDPAKLDALADTLAPLVGTPSKARALLAPPDRAIVAAYARANTRAARELVAAHRAGRLLYGPRKLVPFWIIFHWNRWGLGGPEQTSLSYGVEHVLNPKRAP